MGTGGLTPPGRHRRRTTMPNRSSTGGIGGGIGNNGYGTYGGGGISNANVGSLGAGSPLGGVGPGNGVRNSGGSPKGGVDKDLGGGPVTGGAASPNTPLMTGAGVGDTSVGSQGPTGGEQGEGEGFAYRAKALYTCVWFLFPTFCVRSEALFTFRYCISG